MNKKLVDALENCLRALEKDETLDSALKRYPFLAERLRPLLESAQAARKVHQLPVPQNAQTRGRARVLSAAAQLREGRSPRRRTGFAWRVAVATLVAIAFIAVGGNDLLTASASSLPGDILYPLKRTVEDTRLTFSSDPAQRQQLQEEFKQRRVQETETLIAEGRIESVEFDGLVTVKTPDGWLIGGVSVIVTPQTHINGTISIGMEVEVIGETQANGNVRALNLKVNDEEEDRDGNPDGEPTELASPEDSPDSESEGTGLPEPTDEHGSGTEETATPEPTELPEDQTTPIPTP